MYDEGLDIQVGNTHYFGYFKYSHVDRQDCPMVMDGKNRLLIGHICSRFPS